MDVPRLHEDEEWPYVATLLPPDLETLARESHALVRRRNVPDAVALMRMALAYAISDLSLKDVAAWASSLEVAEITGPGLFYRLREAESWLERVLARVLADQVGPAPAGWRLRIVDATVLTGPGAQGTEWRAHVGVDPASGALTEVEVTDSHGGEGLARHALKPGQLVLGDRAYATAAGLYAAKQSGAEVVVRLNPYTIRVCRENREKFQLLEETGKVPQTGVLEIKIVVPVPPPQRFKTNKPWPLVKAIAWIPARVLASRSRKGEVIWVLTTLDSSALAPIDALQLYRFRWQVELCFKRLKSLLHLDTLPSRQGPTAKSWMLARFLAAALAQRLVRPAGSLSPWGYQLR